MIQLATKRGLDMAKEIYKQHGTPDLYPTNVFDGRSWWFYDIGEHIWQIDKSGAHIHWTIKETVTRVWGKLGTTKAVKVAMEHLLFDVNQCSSTSPGK